MYPVVTLLPFALVTFTELVPLIASILEFKVVTNISVITASN